jgi:hypothetical protein
MNKPPKSMLFGLVLLSLAIANPVWSSGVLGSFGADQPVSLKDLQPRLADGEWYNESWCHNVYLPDDSFIAVDFRVSNVAVTSDHDGLFHARYVDARGKKTKCEVKLDDDEWSYSRKGFSLDFGKGKVSGDLEGLKVSVRCKRLSMDLEYRNQVPPYKPGSGAVRFGDDDGSYQVVFYSPRARVTGTLTLGGRTRSIEGVGIATHTRYDMRPDKQFHRWFRFKHIDKDISIILEEMEVSREYSLARRGWALVLDADKGIVTTQRVRLVYDGFIKDENSEEGYQIPRRVRIAAVDGESQLTGVLLMQRVKKVRDVTKDMNAVLRAIFRRFTKPREYHLECNFKFKIKAPQADKPIEGIGVYRYQYVNP